MKQYYVLFIEGDVEPSLEGPFATSDERDERALNLKIEHGPEHGIFMLDIVSYGYMPALQVNSYSTAFFKEVWDRYEQEQKA